MNEELRMEGLGVIPEGLGVISEALRGYLGRP